MIKIKNLFYNYDSRFSALFDINLNIKNNTIIFSNNELSSLTLFRIIAKQETDYKGEVFLFNKNLKEIKFKDISLSYITQNPILLKNKKADYNIAYPKILRKENKKVCIQKANELLNEFNIENKKAKELSYYESLLISFLRTILRKPKIVLIDNIFTKLSINELNQILKLIDVLKAESLIVVCIDDQKLKKNFKDFDYFILDNGLIEKKDPE